MDSIFWFPFMAAGFGIIMVVGILVFAFWILMIVDCAKRVFKNTIEKVVWLVVVIAGGWIGALVYFIVVRSINRQGLFKD
jgi:uncharacterized membrane protein YsdA (DUF1294 family)